MLCKKWLNVLSRADHDRLRRDNEPFSPNSAHARNVTIERWPLSIVLASLFILTTSAVSADEQKSLAEQMPRTQPVEPSQALKTFQLQRGFKLQLVAHEPAVSDPVDACFDADGRMYVVEMHGYPFSHEPTRLNPKGGGRRNAGIVRLLEDTNGDGHFDRSVKFADDITWPTSVACFKGGVFVLAPPHLHYFKDTDGDDVADVRKVIFTGFSRDNVQGLANNMKWGLDNKIYLAAGRNPSVLKHKGQTLLKLGRSDFRFDPVTEKVEAVTGGQQFGHSMDDWGNRFVCSNSNHIQQIVFNGDYLKRNSGFAVTSTIRTIAKEGAAATVFRRSPAEPWRVVRTRRRVADPKMRARLSRTEQFAIGYFTSATGITILRGSAYPAAFRGNAFIGDVGGNLIHRKLLTPNGVSFVATRADENNEFIASTDNWFRPVNFVNAPDGTLLILDMYRETIEHPYSIPDDIKQHVDLQSGSDRGRVYRLVAPHMQRGQTRKLAQASISKLVAQLESLNSWNRESAQRLIWERQDRTAIKPLTKLVTKSAQPLARLHALCSLDGIGGLSAKLVTTALQDAHPEVRRHACRLAEQFTTAADVRSALIELAKDESLRVRFQLALSAGEMKDADAISILAQIAAQDSNNRDIRAAAMTSIANRADRLADVLLNNSEFLEKSGSTVWLTEIARTAGAENDVKSQIKMLNVISQAKQRVRQRALLQSFGDGLKRRGRSIDMLLKHDSVSPSIRARVATMFAEAATTANDARQKEAERVASIGLLAFAEPVFALRRLADLLEPQNSQSIQRATISSISKLASARVSDALLSNWSSYSPQLRRDVVDALMRSSQRTTALLQAVEAEAVLSIDITRDAKQLLMNHTNVKVRDRARKVFAKEVNADRAAVVAKYQAVLDRIGNAERGREVFKKTCAACHQVGKLGKQVGPDLKSTQNKSARDLLIAILDPSREAQPNFMTYAVITVEGETLSGIIVAETAVSLTLRRSEGKGDIVLRSQIEQMKSTGKSLMPDGVEKDVNLQQMADLIEFIRSLPRQSK